MLPLLPTMTAPALLPAPPLPPTPTFSFHGSSGSPPVA